MKLGPVTKLGKRNTGTSKNLTRMSCQQNMTLFTFFQFMADLEQSGNQIPDAWSVKLIFSLAVTLYLTKTANRTKKSVTQLSSYCFE